MIQMTEETILETVKILSSLVEEAFPNIPVIFSIGNHDFEPANT